MRRGEEGDLIDEKRAPEKEKKGETRTKMLVLAPSWVTLPFNKVKYIVTVLYA